MYENELISTDVCRERMPLILEHTPCKQVRFHDLRHTFATVALQSGIDVKTVSNMLGHYSAGFTLDTYTHVTDQMQKAAAQRMQGVMDAALPDEQPDLPQDNTCKVIEFKRAVNS